jgi:hypothetical protein
VNDCVRYAHARAMMPPGSCQSDAAVEKLMKMYSCLCELRCHAVNVVATRIYY